MLGIDTFFIVQQIFSDFNRNQCVIGIFKVETFPHAD